MAAFVHSFLAEVCLCGLRSRRRVDKHTASMLVIFLVGFFTPFIAARVLSHVEPLPLLHELRCFFGFPLLLEESVAMTKPVFFFDL